jgi:hypothetical protein
LATGGTVSDVDVASPVSTGGGGTVFEQHVDAFFLAMLLLEGVPPVLLDCQTGEIHLQAGHLGWDTDDLLVVGSGSAGVKRHVAIQVKRRFSISASDSECRKTFAALWHDFTNDRFDADRDRLAILTQLGTERLHNTFASALTCARASQSPSDFANRMKAYVAAVAQEQVGIVRSIITEEDGGRAPDESQFWRFLRTVHIVNLDLGTDTGHTEALVKTLLAQTATGPDPVGAAQATWNELLALVGSGMPAAKSYKRTDLPQQLLPRHAAGLSGAPLKTLVEHGRITVDGIRSTIGAAVTIERGASVTSVLERLRVSRVVVLAGSAGSGKSAIAKAVVAALGQDTCRLAFRAEEFAVAHIDKALHDMQVDATGTQLFAALAAQDQTVILIDSVERLLESSVRDAFVDLLRLVRENDNLSLLLTCRDYAVETVRASLLTQNGIAHAVQVASELSNAELEQAAGSEPQLKVPLSQPRLRAILRMPYLLDMAAGLDWSQTTPPPETERDFRRKCWSEVVRRDVVRADGLPLKRERAFLELALRRARALTPFVNCADLDAQALEALRGDNLVVVRSPGTHGAPAHDVLEDWAVTEWLSGQFEVHQRQPALLAADVAGFPAIRRGYRRWLGEMFEVDASTADAFLLSVLREPTIPPYFQDDTLVALLLSTAAEPFLVRQRQALLANDGALLTQVIHLLRVACKEPLQGFADVPALSTHMLVPKGDGWPAVLAIVSEALSELLPKQTGLLLGFLEDWARQVSWDKPAPRGFEQAGAIAFALLKYAGGYGRDDSQKRVFGVIAKIPSANLAAFSDLLSRAKARNRDDRTAWEFADFLLPGWESAFACRDFPDEVAAFVLAHCCLSEQDLSDRHPMHYSPGIEHYFGVRDHTNMEFFPASALRGSFLFLMRSHPRIGAGLILDLLNHAGRWYGERLWPEDRLEAARQISLEIPGEAGVVQWCNPRLWCIYRGTSVAPSVLETALMALEHWLLEMSAVDDFDTEAWLLHLLRKSNNVAVTAVVASVSIAHPKTCGRAGVALLTSRDLFDIDRWRMVQDRGGSVLDTFPPRDFEAKVYQDERKRSRALPHRAKDLESLALELQLTTQRQVVWDALDQHRAALPPLAEQSEEDRLWRLVLHRIDLRTFRETRELPGSTTKGAETAPPGLFYAPGPVDEDVQTLLDQHAPIQEQQNADMALFHWGMALWQRNESSTADPNAWQDKLQEAKHRVTREPPIEDFMSGGPGFVAAVCVRDHWDEMTGESQLWCTQVLTDAIAMHSDAVADVVRYARNSLSPDRAAAYLTSFIITRTRDHDLATRARAALADALLHSVGEVSAFAAEGVGYHLQEDWQDLAIQCAGMLAKHGRLVSKRWRDEQRKAYPKRAPAEQIIAADVPALRSELIAGTILGEQELDGVGLRDWAGRAAARRILATLAHAPQLESARRFHRRALEAVVEDWNVDRRERGMTERRDFEFESECLQRVSQFLLKLSAPDAVGVAEPLLSAVADHPREVAGFVEHLIAAEDATVGASAFWDIWHAFADRIQSARWLKSIDSQHSEGAELLRAMFLNIAWKKGVRHWRRLDGAETRVDAFVGRLPVSGVLLAAYARLLHDVGERSLPAGFVIVQGLLRDGNASAMLSHEATVYYLGAILSRYVYGQPLKLKEVPSVRTAVIDILDALVVAGSSAAFRMRDDFVTPLAAA